LSALDVAGGGLKGLPPLSRRSRLWLAVAAAAVLIAFSADGLFQPGAFPVQRVSFEGEFRHVTPQALREAVAKEVHGNFFALDLKRVERAAKTLPWVDHVSVRREWPQSLHIQYTEHRIVARWGDDAWLSSSSALVTGADDVPKHVLPVLDGPPGTQARVLARFNEMSGLTGSAGLEVTGVRLSPRRAWRLVVRDAAANAEFTVMLGRSELRPRLERFLRVYRAELAQSAARLERIDLRYPNGFAVAWKAGAEAAG